MRSLRLAIASICTFLSLVSTLPIGAQTPASEGPPKLHTDFPRGEVISRVATLDDPGQQYSLYLPEDYSSEKVWPVLLVLDPRGQAEASLRRYLPAAQRHGWIVLSSHQSRSDTYSTVTSDAFKAILKDLADRKFSVHVHRLYLTGMSGTAFICWHFAKALPEAVAGVLGVGAGLPRDLQSTGDRVDFDYYGIAGTADFNYQDQRRLDLALGEIGSNHRFDVWLGGHGWPPEDDLLVAGVDWLELMAMKRGFTPRREDFITQQFEADLARAESAEGPLARLRSWNQRVRDFEGLRDTSQAKARLAVLEKDPEVIRALKQEKRLERQEISYRERLNRWLAKVRQSLVPPENQRSLGELQIKKLLEQAKDREDRYAARSAQRRLETTWVHASFYLPTEFEERGRLDSAFQMLELAQAIFPERPQTHLRMAQIHVRRGRIDRAFEALNTASESGWVRVEWLRQNEVWAPLHRDPRWPALLARLGSQSSP